MSEKFRQHRARVIAIGNQKGGVGKSTLTVHLAAGLGEMGRQCLVWDLDMNRGSSVQLGIPKEMPVLGSYEVLIGQEDPVEVVIGNGDIEGIDRHRTSTYAARSNPRKTRCLMRAPIRKPKDVLDPLVTKRRGATQRLS